MVGRDVSVTQVLDGIEQAYRIGFAPIKINVVVLRGKNDHQVLDLLKHFRGTGHIVRFIEYMDVGNQNDWSKEQVVRSAELLEVIGEKWAVEPLEPTRPGEVAKRYRYSDGQGEIGFISSVSVPFCADCNRARLSADGKIYTCLFATQGHDLKSTLREGTSGETLLQEIRSLWQSRDDHYSEERFQIRRNIEDGPDKVEMYRIGG
jgi:cyclic pyranopterin phosphate synthase